MQDRKEFARWVRWLKRHFPVTDTVRVSLVPPSQMEAGDLGETCYGNSVTRVRIASNLSIDLTLETLVHEWAHIRRDHLPESPFDTPGGHDATFYTILGEIDSAWRKHRK